MTASELLAKAERAVTAAFPDRAGALLDVLERRLWFAASTLPERLVPGEDGEIEPHEFVVCAVCARTPRATAHAVMSTGRAWERFDLARFFEIQVVGGSLRAPVLVCGPCRFVAGADPSSDDAALADLVRALRADERLVEELTRRFFAVRLPGARHSACEACGTRAPAEGHRGALCAACWQAARSVR